MRGFIKLVVPEMKLLILLRSVDEDNSNSALSIKSKDKSEYLSPINMTDHL